MLLHAGTLILYLLTTQVTDILGECRRKKIEADMDAAIILLESSVRRIEKILKKISKNQQTNVNVQAIRLGKRICTLWETTTALCEATFDTGEWVIIQRRVSADVDFYRGWDDYKNFFGNLNTSFWLGNDAIHRLTVEGYNELRIELIYDGKRHFALYSDFHVDSERMNYRLLVSGYSGTAEDGLSYHNNKNFSTFDRDNDKHDTNCAEKFQAGWWFYDCIHSNLNGVWGLESNYLGIAWPHLVDWAHSVRFTEMKLRRVV